jgi:hypothetical protein
MQKSLLELTMEDLALIEELASYFFTPREIAIMVEINPDEAVIKAEAEGNKFYDAFQKGRLQSEMDLRKSIIKLAKSGSSPAQTMSLDLFTKSKIKMLDR